jgi:hypothetical protein
MATQEKSPPRQKRIQIDEAAPAKYQKKRPPPEFWDNLSRIPLCRAAIHELDRRYISNGSFRPLPSYNLQQNRPNLEYNQADIELKRFSRHGGPNLRSVRGVSRMLLTLGILLI